jgi:hypothetical protein
MKREKCLSTDCEDELLSAEAESEGACMECGSTPADFDAERQRKEALERNPPLRMSLLEPDE